LVGVFGGRSDFSRLALHCLAQEGFSVRAFSITVDVIDRIKQLRPSLIIVDATATGRVALDLCRGIRRVNSLSRTPVILFSPKASGEERALGLESGADDYITGLSSGREIVARVRAVVRRFAREEAFPGLLPMLRPWPDSSSGTNRPIISAGDLELDLAAMKVFVRDSEIETTNLEFRLLHFLLCHEGRVFTRQELLDAVWNVQFVELRSVDACIRRLRRKLDLEPPRTYLKTIRGAGYCLVSTSD